MTVASASVKSSSLSPMKLFLGAARSSCRQPAYFFRGSWTGAWAEVPARDLWSFRCMQWTQWPEHCRRGGRCAVHRPAPSWRRRVRTAPSVRTAVLCREARGWLRRRDRCLLEQAETGCALGRAGAAFSLAPAPVCVPDARGSLSGTRGTRLGVREAGVAPTHRVIMIGVTAENAPNCRLDVLQWSER